MSTLDLVVPPVDRPSNGVVLRDAAVDDEDDQSIDSEFPSYDYSHDTIKSDVSKPTYIRTCLADLLATEKVPQLEAALHVLPSLIEMSKVECEEVAVELVRILLNYNSTFEIDNFHQLQFQALTSLCSTYPLLVSDYLCQQFYERNYTLQQRSLILKTIQESAKRLAQIEQIRSHIEEDEEESEEDDPWRSVIHQRLKLKTKYKRSAVARTASKVKKENHFGSLVGHFFYPLISQIDRSSPHLALIDGDQDHLLLCELLACLGRLCIHGQNTVILLALVKAFLQVLTSLREHADAGVRHAVVYAYACCFVSLNGHCPDDDLQSALIELKQWFDALIARDSNSEVQKLARSVRQILLKSLQEISLSQCWLEINERNLDGQRMIGKRSVMSFHFVSSSRLFLVKWTRRKSWRFANHRHLTLIERKRETLSFSEMKKEEERKKWWASFARRRDSDLPHLCNYLSFRFSSNFFSAKIFAQWYHFSAKTPLREISKVNTDMR